MLGSPLRRLELQTDALLASCGMRVAKPSTRRHHPSTHSTPEPPHPPPHTDTRQPAWEETSQLTAAPPVDAAPGCVPTPPRHEAGCQTAVGPSPAAFSSFCSALSPPTERRGPAPVEGLRRLVSLSEVDVGYLLASLGFQRYISGFMAVGVSGPDLARCSEDDLNDCGVHFRCVG